MCNLSYFNTIAINKYTVLYLRLHFSYSSSGYVLVLSVVICEQDVFSLKHLPLTVQHVSIYGHWHMRLLMLARKENKTRSKMHK